jgi:hypothetical protein
MQKPMTQQAMLQSANFNGGQINNTPPQQPASNGYPQMVYPAGAPGTATRSPSGQSDMLLNGVTAANYNTQVSYPGAVNQATFQGAAGNAPTQFGNVPASGLKTTTIQLPPRVGNRLGSQNGAAMPKQNGNMGNAVSAITPTAQTMMQMQAAGIDPRTQNAMLGQQAGVVPQAMDNTQYNNPQYVNTQYGNTQYGNTGLNQPMSGGMPQSSGYNNGPTSTPQLQQLPADFGPRKREARVR